MEFNSGFKVLIYIPIDSFCTVNITLELIYLPA